MPVSEATYRRVALEDRDSKWELHCGQLRQKDGMTAAHNDVGDVLVFRIQTQLPMAEFRVRSDKGRVRRPGGNYFIPDVMVVPMGLIDTFRKAYPTELEFYDDPLPFIAEVWSPSTGKFDLETKVPDYQARGDREIWCFHLRDKTLTVWVRQADGSYTEQIYRGGLVHLTTLPGVVVDLDELIRLAGDRD